MIQLISAFLPRAADRVLGFLHREDGADAIEYLLTIAVISVVIVGAIASGLWGTFATTTIAAVQSAVSGCITAGPAC